VRKLALAGSAAIALFALIRCAPGLADDQCATSGGGFFDTFEGDVDCGWGVEGMQDSGASISDGALLVRSVSPGKITWVNPGLDAGDVTVTVSAQLREGPEDNAFGAICRYVDESNFYAFLISSDGYYAIALYESGQETVRYLTGEGHYLQSEAIAKGDGTNSIRVSCSGSQLDMEVNGVEIASVSDATLSSGDVGLAVSTFVQSPVTIAFDDFLVEP